MSEANYKLIRDIPRITHISLHNEFFFKVFINTNLHEKIIVSYVSTQLIMYNCLKLKPSKLQSSNYVFQRQDTQSCDTYVGSAPHLHFF